MWTVPTASRKRSSTCRWTRNSVGSPQREQGTTKHTKHTKKKAERREKTEKFLAGFLRFLFFVCFFCFVVPCSRCGLQIRHFSPRAAFSRSAANSVGPQYFS